MKRLLALSAALAVVAVATTNAATISIQPLYSSQGIYSLYLNGGTDVFDSIGVKLTPGAGFTFINQSSGGSGGPRPAGQAFSYRNRILDLDPTDPDTPGGLGWAIVGPASNSNELSFGGGPANAKINTNGNLFLANVMLSSPRGFGSATVNLVNNGVDLPPITTLLFPIIPEPSACILVGIGALGLAAARRRLV